MIRPKFICNDCVHKSICRYAKDMTKIISEIDTVCAYYNDLLPINLSHLSCSYLTTKSEEELNNEQKR
jgi:hypothetical protein